MLFDLPAMRRNGDEIDLFVVVPGQFEEPDSIRLIWLRRNINDPRLDGRCHRCGRPEPRASRLSGPNNIGSRWAGVGVGLLDRIKGDETCIVLALNSDLLTALPADCF